VNVDAALFTSSKQMGAGVVIRDHNGLCLAACGERSDNVTMPEMAEALAIRRAVVFAREEGFSNIIIGSDCLSVIQRVNSSVIDRSTTGSVIEDIKFCSKAFSSCDFRHVPRVLNVAAHQLARGCVSYVNSAWRGVSPDCIQEALCNDILIKYQ
jgi:ribonuclease HI